MPAEPPSAPGKPSITKVKATYMRIKWSPPKSDGGSPITKYAVEIRDDKSEWRHECFVKESTTKRITGLLEGSKYQFRVKVWNEAGEGVTSEPSEMRLCKAPFGTYKADS